jgi:hypothetical protein
MEFINWLVSELTFLCTTKQTSEAYEASSGVNSHPGASNGSCVEEIWKLFKEIVFQSMVLCVPHTIMRKKTDPKCYNREVKWLKVKVTRV